MKNCVIRKGQLLTCNELIKGKKVLFHTQGEQYYESSLKVDVTTTVVKSYSCKKFILGECEEVSGLVSKIPKFQIGSYERDSEEQIGSQNKFSVIVPVSTMAKAVAYAKGLSNIGNNLRDTISMDKENLLPIIKGECQSFDQLRALKRKVSSYNQTKKVSVLAKLAESKLSKNSPEWIMAYGKIMAAERVQLTPYSLRVNINIKHNIYDEYHESNFEDIKDKVKYYSGRNKLYSEDRNYVIEIPILRINQFKALIQLIDKWSLEAVKQLLNNMNGIELVKQDQMTESQLSDDAKLAESLNKTFSPENGKDEDNDDLINIFDSNEVLDRPSDSRIISLNDDKLTLNDD
jgi:hypothetical protein